MKRPTTILAIALLAVIPALPRAAGASEIRCGLKAGGNMARPAGFDGQDPVTTLKTKTGFSGGLFVAIDFSRTLSLQWEALYTMKGAVYVAGDDATSKLYADYIEVPLLLKARIPLDVVQPFVFAGPTIGFKLQEKLESNGQEVPLDGALLKNNDFGAIVGAGLNLGPNFMADIRYGLGMQKVASAFQGEVPRDLKNGVWSVGVGIFF